MKCMTLIPLFVSVMPSYAQQRDAFSYCSEKAETQLAITQCAIEDQERASAEYTVVLAQVLARTQYVGDDDLEHAKEKVRAAEKAWAVYLDAFIEARYPAENKRDAYGSRYLQIEAELRAKMTRRHIEDLRILLSPYAGK